MSALSRMEETFPPIVGQTSQRMASFSMMTGWVVMDVPGQPQTVTCTNPGPLAPGASSALELTVRPGPSAVLKVVVRVLAPSWIAAERVELFANGIRIRSAPFSSRARREGGVAAEVQWEIARPKHDVHLIAIATAPGHTSPHWPIARPYQSVSPQWVSRVIGATNPIWVDADADG